MNSIGKLYIDCPEHKGDNEFTPNRELSEYEYVKMLRDYSATIGTSSTYNNNRFAVKDLENNNERNVFKCATAKVFDISGAPCGVNELYRIQKTGMGVLIIEVIDEDIDDSFETEFMFWKKDSMNINNDSEIDKDERIRFLPVKDLRFELDEHMFQLYGCKIYCEYDRMKVAVIIQKINEI